MRQEGQAPVVEIVQAASVQESHVLKQALCEHLGAHIDPLTHHATRWGIDLEAERVENDLCKVIVVTISVNKLLKIVKDLKLSQQLADA